MFEVKTKNCHKKHNKDKKYFVFSPYEKNNKTEIKNISDKNEYEIIVSTKDKVLINETIIDNEEKIFILIPNEKLNIVFMDYRDNSKLKLFYKKRVNNNNVDENNFDWKQYLENYEDLRKAGIITKEKAWEYWINYGKCEGRKINLNNDLINKKLYIKNIDSELKKFLDYPVLFHKYLLNIRNYKNNNITYELIHLYNYNKNNKFWCHIHCFDLDNFDIFFNDYLVKIKKYFNILITYCISLKKNIYNYVDYLLIKCDNYGMDIGSKFVCVDFLKKNKIEYEYILFIHSKSNEYKRKLYIEPLINNLDFLLNFKNNDIWGFFPPVILDGDYYHIIHDNTIIDTNNINGKISSWSERNTLYLNEFINYYNLNYRNKFFSEGNCYILKKDIIDIIFNNIDIYGVLNTKNSFDYSWVRLYYKQNDNIYETYQKYKINKWFGNNLETNKGHDGLADAMIEHSFERLIILFIEKFKKKIKIFARNEQNRITNSISEYINNCINKSLFDGKQTLDYMKILNKKTIILIAAHTNSELKIKSLVNNLQYLKNISDKIILINSIDFINSELEFEIKNKYNDLNINYVYVQNTNYICHKKWLDYYLENKEFVNKYDNIILTNDSYLIIKELYEFEKIFYEDIEESTLLASNEGYFHHTDFLRRYNKIGLQKIMKYYIENINMNNNISFKTMINKFEIDSLNIFNSSNYLFYEKESVNIHFIEPYCQIYLEKYNYPIIKIKRLEYTNYCEPINFDSKPFEPQIYKSLHPDLMELNDLELHKHFNDCGIKEGRKYYHGQETIFVKYFYNILNEIKFNLKYS